MAFKAIDRAKEQASTAGTGNFTLPGAPVLPEFQAFITKLTANGDRTFYCAVNGSQWETGLLTRVDATTFSRAVYDNSSNTTAAINFTAPPVVFSTVPGAALSPLAGPAFSMFATVNQALPGGAATKINLGSIEYDPNNACDTVLSRFAPKIAGVYHISAGITFTASLATLTNISLQKNGAEARRGTQSDSATWAIVLSGDVMMNGTTDYLELTSFVNTARTVSSGSATTFMCGHLVRATP